MNKKVITIIASLPFFIIMGGLSLYSIWAFSGYLLIGYILGFMFIEEDTNSDVIFIHGVYLKYIIAWPIVILLNNLFQKR